MGHNSLQVCMDSSDWLQGTIHEDSTTMDSSSPLSGDMLTCSRPMIERRLRPQHDQALKCPRCDSTHTKFCYYNNYSLSQPRYFCKTCRRYWTKGGTLRNIPVGGGCRKNKKVSPNNSNKKPNDNINVNPSSSSLMNNHLGGGGMSSSSSSHLHHHNPTDLHLSFPDQMQFSHLNNLMLGSSSSPSFMDSRYNGPIDFMESKLEAIVGNSRNYDFMGNGADHLGGMMGGLGNNMGAETSFHHQGICSPFGISSSLDGNNTGTNFMDTCQRLMLPYEHQENHDQDHHHHHNGMMDVKPNTKLLSLEWQDQGGCSDHHGKESFGYLNGLGSSWTNVMNNYGPSTTNPLV